MEAKQGGAIVAMIACIGGSGTIVPVEVVVT